MTPFSPKVWAGDSTQMLAQQTDINCMNQIVGPYIPDTIAYYSTNSQIASMNVAGAALALSAGYSNVGGTWDAVTWENNGISCQAYQENVDEQVFMEVFRVTITKSDGSALPNPLRLGINGGGNDRKQQLKATVEPTPQTNSVDIVGSSKLTVSNVSKNAGTGVITFDVVGSTASSSAGDSTIKAKIGNQEVASKNVSVVIPKKVSNQSVGSLTVTNRALDDESSPKAIGVTHGLSVYLATAYCKIVTVTVKDQFDVTIGDVYLNGKVDEDLGGVYGWQNTNLVLNSSSTYPDPVCVLKAKTNPRPTLQISGNESIIAAFLAGSQIALTTESYSVTIPVRVDGFVLNPSLGTRNISSSPPNTVNITF